ncbi:hypothetical protein K474DRAFT_1700506 [Panus rudis PR-1116 ss-1]|nr:hypothetical protein K474DRAFT_1700506 [Panus rudis PR-1116 ss-1]
MIRDRDRSHANSPVQGTPMRSSTEDKVRSSASDSNKIRNDNIIAYIKDELSSRVGGFIPGYPVVDFVRNVWGFSPEHIPLGQTGYELKAQLIYAYDTTEYIKGKNYKSDERNSCVVFADIFNELARLVKVNYDELMGSHPLSSDFDRQLYFLCERILEGYYAGLKPDYAFVPKGSLDDRKIKLHWQQTGSVAEQKKKKAIELDGPGEDIIINPGLLLPDNSASSAGNDVQPQNRRRGEKGAAKVPTRKDAKGGRRGTPLRNVVASGGETSALTVPSVTDGAVPTLVSEAQQPDDDSEGGPLEGKGTLQPPVGEGEQPLPVTAAPTGSLPDATAAPKLKAGNVRNEDIQIAKYLNELLNHGVRQYGSGFLVEGDWITLWYADRFGVVKSVNFDWRKEPHFLLLVVAALVFADRQKLGFSPFVAVHPTAPEGDSFSTATLRIPGPKGAQDDEPNEAGEANQKCGGEGEGRGGGEGDVQGSVQEDVQGKGKGKDDDKEPIGNDEDKTGAKAKHCTLDIDGKEIKNTLQFSFDLTPPRRMRTAYGIIGRGTTVIPIKVTHDEITAKAIRLDEDIPLVAKLAWQHVDRKEDAYIRNIWQRLKNDPTATSMMKHIVDMKCSLSLSMDSPQINLPRAFMSMLPALSLMDMREFHLLVLESYEPLDHIANADQFKKVFLETFKAHHWVWTNAEILHRDISINNIMFRRRGDQVEGVLCDWDLAATKKDLGPPNSYSRVTSKEVETRRAVFHVAKANHSSANVQSDPPNEAAAPTQPPDAQSTKHDETNVVEGQPNTEASVFDGDDTQQRPRYRTGTGPFMALELLAASTDIVPSHRYSFDVQSFFYVFIWVVVTHNPTKQKMGSIPEWRNPDLETTFSAKLAFFMNPSQQHAIVKRAQLSGAYLSLMPWLQRLMMMMDIVATTYSNILKLRMRLLDAFIYKDESMVQPIRMQIKSKERELEEAVTYESFLATVI